MTLTLTDDELVVDGVGSWPRHDVAIRVMSQGPPVTFVVQLPAPAHLLAAPADASTAAFVATWAE